MLRRRRVLFLERDQDLAVHRADRRGIAQRDVNAAIWQADIVENDIDLIVADDLADGRFDLREILLGLLDPCPRRRADMQAHLAGIDLRKEIHPEPGKQKARRDDQQREERDGDQGPANRPGQGIAMDLAKALEPALETRRGSSQQIEPVTPRLLRRLPRASAAMTGGPCAATCERMRYLNSSGTSVNDSSRLATSEMITESESGENRYLAVPVSRNTGTNTTLIDKVARKVGRPTSAVPSRIACSSGSPRRDVPLDVLDHHRALSTRCRRRAQIRPRSWC